MVKTVGDVVNITSELRNFWLPRQLKMEDWLKMRRLDDANKQPNEESIVLNDAVTDLNMAIHLLTSVPAKHRIPITAQDAVQRERGSKSERALLSLWRQLDTQQLLRGKPPFLAEMADFALWLGWINVFAGVTEGKDGEPLFFAEVWNPYDVFQEWDYNGLKTVVHTYDATVDEVAEKAKVWGYEWHGEVTKGKVTVYDFYQRQGDKVVNAIVAGTDWVRPPTEAYDGFPVICVPVGGWADRSGLNDPNYVQRIGMSFLAPNETTYAALNRWTTLLMRMTDRIAQPSFFDRTRGGKGVLRPEDTKRHIVHLDINEEVGTLRLTDTAIPEAGTIIAMLEAKRQKATFPSAMFGSQMFTLSGFALNQLLVAALNVLTPWKNAIQLVLGMIDKIWLDGFKRGHYKPITISGRTRQNTMSGYFVEEWKSEDVPDATFVDVDIPLAIPNNALQKAAVIRQLIPQGDIIDTYTALDEFLDVQDPDLIMKRISESQAVADARQHPLVRQARIAGVLRDQSAQLRKEGKNFEAVALATVAEMLMGQVLPQTATPVASPPVRQPPPEMLPPEMNTENPDVLGSILGEAPPPKPPSPEGLT